MKSFILISFSILISFTTVRSQVLGVQLLGDKDEITLNFDYDNNFIILNLQLSKLPLRFIFDTGAEHIILFEKEIANILGYQYDKNIKIMGADMSTEVLAHISRNVPVKLSKSEEVVRDIIILEEDILHLGKITGSPIDGLIGGRFFRGLFVEIDYKRRQLKLYRNEPIKRLSKGFHKLDLDIKDHKPYISCSLINGQDTLPVRMLLDTGAAIPLLLFLNKNSDVKLPEAYMTGNLGKGLGGDIEGYLGKSQKFLLNDLFEFNNVITSYQNYNPKIFKSLKLERNGLLGNPMLERFEIIIDYISQKVYLKSRKKYNKDFDYDISGLIIYAFGPNLDRYFIKHVMEGSPAEKAGIQQGDIIKKIGILSSKFYDLNGIYKRLIRKKNKKIRLGLERDGKKIKKTIDLTDLLLR